MHFCNELFFWGVFHLVQHYALYCILMKVSNTFKTLWFHCIVFPVSAEVHFTALYYIYVLYEGPSVCFLCIVFPCIVF